MFSQNIVLCKHTCCTFQKNSCQVFVPHQVSKTHDRDSFNVQIHVKHVNDRSDIRTLKLGMNECVHSSEKRTVCNSIQIVIMSVDETPLEMPDMYFK